VAIGPGAGPGMFKVEVVASPAGEAIATVELAADSLLARRGLLQQAVLASAVPSHSVLPETEQPVREAGQMLFAGLLGTGEVAGRYRAAAALAAERGEGLRVVLRINTPALAGLPWEAMYDQAAGAYVCRQDQLVRHVPVASVPAPLQVRPPLRILGVVSSPRELSPLDVDKEQDQLTRALARPASQGLAEVHWAPSATWADLQDLLLDTEWHVLHFIGHGDFDPGRDEGVLALTREDGRADLVAAHRLVDLLRQARPMPRLVVLNSCSGAAAGTSDLFSGTAAALVRGGVSAVVAMQYEISDPAAVAFGRGFYAAITRGRGVDDAVSSGRVAILGLGDRTLEWVTPVLYLRGHDARLFILPAPAEDRDGEGTGSTRGGQRGRNARREETKKDPGPLARAARVLADAEHTAQSITDEPSKAKALAGIARVLAATDPNNASRVLADAERIAQSIVGKPQKAQALADVAAALTASDPDRASRLLADAERIAQSIVGKPQKAQALADVAAALTASDPDRASRLLADAKRIAQSIVAIPQKFGRLADRTPKRADTLAYLARVLADVAATLAATDPDHAERIARSITDERSEATALADVARALAGTDPPRAERIARSITDERPKAKALADVAAALATTDPDHAARLIAEAERIARSIGDKFPQTEAFSREETAGALADVAKVMAAIDPHRAAQLITDAERIARSITAHSHGITGYSYTYGITSEFEKARALADVARALAATDPGRAEGIAQSIWEYGKLRALADVARAMAATDPYRAERIAYSIDREYLKAVVLADVAGALAATDPDRAERIARSITDQFEKARALVTIAAS
jgi:hypothetical protein